MVQKVQNLIAVLGATHCPHNFRAAQGGIDAAVKVDGSLGNLWLASEYRLGHSPRKEEALLLCYLGRFADLVHTLINMKSRRDQILDAFEDIPEMLVRLMKLDYTYKVDSPYRACRDELNISIPLVIAKCIEWLIDRKTCKYTVWLEARGLRMDGLRLILEREQNLRGNLLACYG